MLEICHFQSLKRKVLIFPLTHVTLLAHFSSCGKMFHSVANLIRPYLIVLFLFGTSDVIEADLSDLGGWYQFNSSHWYDGADACKALYTNTNIGKYHRFWIGSQGNYFRMGEKCSNRNVSVMSLAAEL